MFAFAPLPSVRRSPKMLVSLSSKTSGTSSRPIVPAIRTTPSSPVSCPRASRATATVIRRVNRVSRLRYCHVARRRRAAAPRLAPVEPAAAPVERAVRAVAPAEQAVAPAGPAVAPVEQAAPAAPAEPQVRGAPLVVATRVAADSARPVVKEPNRLGRRAAEDLHRGRADKARRRRVAHLPDTRAYRRWRTSRGSDRGPRGRD